MLLYGFASCNAVHGKRWGAVGFMGSLACGVAVAGGVGLSGILGISYNALVAQCLPFLMLGIGVNDMFVVLQMAQEALPDCTSASEWAGKTMERAGPSITLTTATNFAVFLMVGVVKIP